MKDATKVLIVRSRHLENCIRQDYRFRTDRGRLVERSPADLQRKVARKRYEVAQGIRACRAGLHDANPASTRAGHRAGYFAYHYTAFGKRPT